MTTEYLYDYDRICAAHAQSQGLLPVIGKLALHNIPWSLEQTGGYVMCVRVECVNVVRPQFLWLTDADEGADDSQYVLIGHYDEYDCYSESQHDIYVHLEELHLYVEAWRHGRFGWPPPDPSTALPFDEVEARGLDGTLRTR